MSFYLTLAILFILPLLVLPFGISPFETPKVFLAEVFIEIIVVFNIFKGKFALKKLLKLEYLPFLILFLLSLLDLLFLNSPTTLFGNVYRLQGVFLIWHLLLLALISSQMKLAVPKNLPFLTLVLMTISAFLLGGDINERAFGTLGEANSLAAEAVFLLPFIYYLQKGGVKIIGLILILLTIFASGSRSGLIAVAIQFIFIFLVRLKFKLSKAVIVGLILAAFSFILPIIYSTGWYENRAELWYTSLVAGAFAPLFGHGLGNLEQSIHQTSLLLNNNIQYQFVDSSHNFLLDFWVQSGALGVSAIILLLYKAIKTFTLDAKYVELASLLGLIVTLSFNPASVAVLIAFWWLIGRGFAKLAYQKKV